MAKKIITVFGATGNQGASVVNIFLNDPKLNGDWAVRGVTRDASSDRAKALAAKGVDVVGGDLDDKTTLVEAMKGASAAFAMTNYWDKADMELEIQQGKNLADAAKVRIPPLVASSCCVSCSALFGSQAGLQVKGQTMETCIEQA